MLKRIVLTLVLAVLLAGTAGAQNREWEVVAGIAEDIGVGANGAVWIVGSEARGHMALYWENGAWVKAPKRGWKRISVGPNGNAWAINQSNEIHEFAGKAWQKKPGSAQDIGVGKDGSVYIVGTDGTISKWNGSGWSAIAGSGFTRVAVGPNSTPYAVKNDRSVHRWNGSGWSELSGSGVDVGVGPDGSVYVIGGDDKNNPVHLWNEKADSWTEMPMDSFRSIAVGPDGVAWATQGSGKIYRLR